MKNILIPTTLKADVLDAIRTVAHNFRGEKVEVVMLMFSEMPDGITDLLFSTKSGMDTGQSESRILHECKQYVGALDDIELRVHHQYGVSGPLVRNIMEHYEIGLVVLTPSYKGEKDSLHRQAVKILNNCKCPILHLPEKVKELVLEQAIYIDQPTVRVSMEEIQHMLKKEFDIRLVSRAKIDEGQDVEELRPILMETIDKHQVTLLVEARRPEKTGWRAGKKYAQVTLAEKLGVPVLSVIDN